MGRHAATDFHHAAEGRNGTRDQTHIEPNARLARFAIEWFVAEHPDYRNPAIGVLDHGDGLREAAEESLVAIQRELVRLESPLEFDVARRLIRERFRAITALIELDGQKSAKLALLRLTDGYPLTVCMGDYCRIRHGQRDGVETTAGHIRFAVKGCRAIFNEDRRTSGEMWAGLCPECRRKKPRRTQARALRRLVNDVRRGRGATIYVGSATFDLERLEPGS